MALQPDPRFLGVTDPRALVQAPQLNLQRSAEPFLATQSAPTPVPPAAPQSVPQGLALTPVGVPPPAPQPDSAALGRALGVNGASVRPTAPVAPGGAQPAPAAQSGVRGGISKGFEILGAIGTVLSATGAGLQGDNDFLIRLRQEKASQEEFDLRRASLQFDLFKEAVKISQTIPEAQQGVAFDNLNAFVAQAGGQEFNAADFAKSGSDIDLSLFENFAPETKAAILSAGSSFSSPEEFFGSETFKAIQDRDGQIHAENVGGKIEVIRQTLDEANFNLDGFASVTLEELIAFNPQLPEGVRFTPGELTAIQANPSIAGISGQASLGDIEAEARARARGADAGGGGTSGARVNFRAQGQDITLSDGTVVRAGTDISLRPDDPRAQDQINTGGLVRVALGGKVGDVPQEIKDAGQARDQSAIRTAEIAAGLDELDAAGSRATGVTGAFAFALGGLLGQVNQDAADVVTGGITGIDQRQLGRLRTRAQINIARSIELITGEESGRFTQSEQDLARNTLRTLTPSSSVDQIKAAMVVALQLEVVAEEVEAFKAGEPFLEDLNTREGLNAFGARMESLNMNDDEAFETANRLIRLRTELGRRDSTRGQ